MRPIDIARAAGISTQQVRNHLADGVLPPAQRTPGGHRVFTERHRDALLAYRALARGFGHETARAVMAAVYADDLAGALALLDAGHARLHEQRLALHATAGALDATAAGAAPAPGAVPRDGLRVGELAARLGVRASALRVWESAGLLDPDRDRDGHRRYGARHVRDAQLVSLLRQVHHGFAEIKPIIDAFRADPGPAGSGDGSGERAALRAAVARRRAHLTAVSAAMLEASAALHAFTST